MLKLLKLSEKEGSSPCTIQGKKAHLHALQKLCARQHVDTNNYFNVLLNFYYFHPHITCQCEQHQLNFRYKLSSNPTIPRLVVTLDGTSTVII